MGNPFRLVVKAGEALVLQLRIEAWRMPPGGPAGATVPQDGLPERLLDERFHAYLDTCFPSASAQAPLPPATLAFSFATNGSVGGEP